MERIPSFQFYPMDFVSSRCVVAMSPEQRGGYIMLLCHAWMSEKAGTLPDDDELLAALSGLGERWPLCREGILRAFDRGSPDGPPTLIQRRMVRGRKEQRAYYRRASIGGTKRMQGMSQDERRAFASAGANARWGKAVAMQAEMQADAKISSSSSSSSSVESKSKPKPSVNGVDGVSAGTLRSRTLKDWASAFDQHFWPAYPRKVNKAEALKSWLKLSRPEMDLEAHQSLAGDIVSGLEWYVETEWADRESDKIPHAATWLNQTRWKDAFDGIEETQAPGIGH